MRFSFLPVLFFSYAASAADDEFKFSDPNPQVYEFSERASLIDPRIKAYPDIDFLIDNQDGKPADLQNARVDTTVAPRGELAIWLMGHNKGLAERINSYGIHYLRPHYANRWFSKVCTEKPVGPMCRGNVRLEAATGEDFSTDVHLEKPDGMMERTRQYLIWLSKENPRGKWENFLSPDQSEVLWEKVTITGSSHGSTTSARFAKHVKVGRVVALCGPRDNFQTWQSLPSKTPANRFFGFTHVLDGGWTADHYCRSWELLGMHEFGPIVNVEKAEPPYQNTRRLITDFDVKGDDKRAHSSVQPGGSAKKNADGSLGHEAVWRYLYTHPVDEVGEPTPLDPECDKEQAQ
mgnify:CR=1 FL=1